MSDQKTVAIILWSYPKIVTIHRKSGVFYAREIDVTRDTCLEHTSEMIIPPHNNKFKTHWSSRTGLELQSEKYRNWKSISLESKNSETATGIALRELAKRLLYLFTIIIALAHPDDSYLDGLDRENLGIENDEILFINQTMRKIKKEDS
ncbi:hypothetical protein ACFL08_00525 [Patescibacteria group bacterium]